jgi:uncharacterized glyoxalase superfamily protein PhnB
MVAPKPQGWSTVTPRIVTSDVEGLAAFLRAAFGAEGEVCAGRPAELKIGDSMVMISDGGGVRAQMPAFLHLYVEDADQAYAKAIGAGAAPIEAPAAMPWGDRRATVSDIWGNVWQMSAFGGRA